MHKYLYLVPGDIGHPAEIVREGKEKEKIYFSGKGGEVWSSPEIYIIRNHSHLIMA